MPLAVCVMLYSAIMHQKVWSAFSEQKFCFGLSALWLRRAWASSTPAGRIARCMCMSVCVSVCLQPCTVNFKYVFKYSQKLNVGSVMSAVLATRSKDGSSWSMYGTLLLFVTAATDRPSTADYSQTVQIIHTGLRSLQVRAMHKRYS